MSAESGLLELPYYTPIGTCIACHKKCHIQKCQPIIKYPTRSISGQCAKCLGNASRELGEYSYCVIEFPDQTYVGIVTNNALFDADLFADACGSVSIVLWFDGFTIDQAMDIDAGVRCIFAPNSKEKLSTLNGTIPRISTVAQQRIEHILLKR